MRILYKYRIESHLTQSELANSIGVTKQYISQIENGKCKPSNEILVKIAKELNIPLCEAMDLCKNCSRKCTKKFF